MTNIEKFRQLGISEEILSVIAELGFTEPSEIQKKAIPLIISRKDVIGKSATGSGKTLAFAAGIIPKIKHGSGISALILTPTRELAEQVSRNIHKFSKNHKLNVTQVYGGVSFEPQMRQLRNSDIVVGTPGRILDHINRRTLNLSRVKFLVLDEADRMLDMGFLKSVASIIKLCPQERQTLLFSATIPNEIKYIADKYMIHPIQISAEDQVDPTKLNQVYYEVPTNEKFSLLLHLLKLEKNGVVMVFCNTRRNVDKLTNNLNKYGIHCMAIHGGLSQYQRSETLKAFHQKDTLVLICTDIAARGLDIKDVSHVYNFDIPGVADDYIHRIGRTARAGKNGIAISFVSQGDHTEFKQICREKNIEMEKLKLPQIKIIPLNFNSNEDRKIARRGGRSFSKEKRINKDFEGKKHYSKKRHNKKRHQRCKGGNNFKRRY